jgi:hypothetical protein
VKWYRSPFTIRGPSKKLGDRRRRRADQPGDSPAGVLRWLAGPVKELFGYWQLGALHKIESEDVVNAVVRYASGATGVFRRRRLSGRGTRSGLSFTGRRGRRLFRATSSQHGTWKMIRAIRLPVSKEVASGSSIRWRFRLNRSSASSDFGEAIRTGRKPLVSGEERISGAGDCAGRVPELQDGEKVGLG